ncbi:hypothetical protein ARALYDRAFT_891796 [Arabidopsis lyrata subsp. lyrata]|uniref:Exoribonuclease phosphorolytic domain-containing protein n=1 Tax=Arabidopsis lyrata subsp. lyrata TaxID=81972 RepID=D7KE38_ARALL|nr:hypothetical protein ARALYDRAFT_891796 [Arabidopsis lyrata subsp. lyrata]
MLRTRDAYTFENSCVVCEVSIGAIEIDREDGRTPDQLRPLACSRNILHRPHGSASWSQGDTKVLAAVYGPKPGTRKNENPEKACFEVIWKPKSGQIVFPNTTLSVLPEGSSLVEGEPVEDGIIKLVTHGVMSVDDYFWCVENGRAATASLSAFFRKNFQ